MVARNDAICGFMQKKAAIEYKKFFIILLAGVYYGAMYGGSTTSILLDTPGASSSVATILNGYQMAKQRRAGSALAIAAIGSFDAWNSRFENDGDFNGGVHYV
jgi:hypothetical protein